MTQLRSEIAESVGAMPSIQLHHGDALDVLPTLADNSIDAIVTDPPAGINFMQKEFDSDRGGRAQWVAWLAGIIREALRVLKPGGRALVWSIPRTSHWTACAVEDAGFIIENTVAHFFGNGFPKGKGQLKPAREDWILCRKPGGKVPALNVDACRVGTDDNTHRRNNAMGYGGNARPFEGGGNPAGRWPPNLLLSHSAECVRVGEKRVKDPTTNNPTASRGRHGAIYGDDCAHPIAKYCDESGKETVADWRCSPSCPVALLDAQSGIRTSGLLRAGTRRYSDARQCYSSGGALGPGAVVALQDFGGDTGTASRFFPQLAADPLDDVTPFLYAAKASRSERNRGCEGLPERGRESDGGNNRPNLRCVSCGKQRQSGSPCVCPDPDLVEAPRGPRANHHPTVKSIALMSWLVKLITPPSGVVLDCFMGSGSTGVACVAEGFGFVGIEREAEYFAIAEARIAHAQRERQPVQAALAI